MPKFSYIAIDSQKKVVQGKTDLNDRSAVIAALQKQNLRPITIKELKKNQQLSLNIELFSSTKVKSNQLVIFTRQLSAMTSAGVPLLRSLSSLQQHAEDKVLKKILLSVMKRVEAGDPLADALSDYPKTFNDVYVNMVRAGESAGILDDILKRLAHQQEKSAAIRRRIKSAMAYPIVLIVITVVAFFGLMLFVVPQIGKILTDLGGPDAELPMITQIMLGISSFITTWWYVLVPIIAGVIFAFVRYIKTKRGRFIFDGILLKTPGIKGIIMKIAVARFARTFSALMGAGVAVLESLDVTSRAVGNSHFEKALKEAAVEVTNGSSLAAVVERNELFPAIVAQMLSVGEETGQTDTVLVKVAEFYEEEVDLAIDGISSIIEPAMIVLMGSMVGLIAASVMTPIASLSQNIQA